MTSTLLLVDAMSVAYRVFHAIRGLSTAAGRPTNAVYGFIKTLTRVERLWKPTHCLVAFDGGSPPARLELLAEYKAQRPGMPDALREQMEEIEEYLDRAAVKRARLEKEEADDVIASAAARAGRAGMNVLIVSGDKDLMQLVDRNTSILFPNSADSGCGPDGVVARTGVTPRQIVDWLALTGDSSDNIPGVPGVGAKTAVGWLKKFGALDSIISHIEELKPEKARLNLADNLDVVRRNVQIMTLDKALDLPVSLEDMRVGRPDTGRLLEFYEKMEFHSLARELKTPTLF